MFQSTITDKILIICSAVILPIMLYVLRRDFLGDPVVDFGSELFLASEILNGSRLYIDYFYYYGPLGPYVNAFGLAIFGNSWSSLVTLHLFIFLFFLYALFKIFSAFASARLVAFFLGFVCLFFGFNHVTGTGNYNFLTPYRSALPYALTVSAYSLWFFLRQKPGSLFLSGLFAGLCFFGKSEVFFALAMSVGLVSAFSREHARKFVYFLGGGAASAVAVTLILAFLRMPPAALWRGVIDSYLIPIQHSELAQLNFYQNVFGWNSALASGIFFPAFFFCALFWVAPILLWRKFGPRGPRFLFYASPALLLAMLAILKYLSAFHLGIWVYLTPFVAFGALVLATVKRVAGSVGHISELQLFAAFSFFLSLKIFFRADVDHYGFALALPSCLLTVFLFMKILPNQFWPDTSSIIARRTWQAFFAGTLIPSLILNFYLTEKYQIARSVEAPWASARFFFFPVIRQWAALESYIREAHPNAKTMQVIPEGLFFNYLLGKSPSLPHMSLLPDQFAVYGTKSIIELLEKRPPDISVYLPRALNEFGMGNFENGYGKEIHDWLQKRGARDSGFPQALRDLGFELIVSGEYLRRLGGPRIGLLGESTTSR